MKFNKGPRTVSGLPSIISPGEKFRARFACTVAREIYITARGSIVVMPPEGTGSTSTGQEFRLLCMALGMGRLTSGVPVLLNAFAPLARPGYSEEITGRGIFLSSEISVSFRLNFPTALPLVDEIITVSQIVLFSLSIRHAKNPISPPVRVSRVTISSILHLTTL